MTVLRSIVLISFLWLPAVLAQSGGIQQGMERAVNMQREALVRLQGDFLGPPEQRREEISSTITFKNPKAEKFFVDGRKLPDVNFDVGPSWSGLMPISSHENETRKLFFWFWPTNNPAHGDELLFWTNGGPGCSSLEGFFQENGPVTWSWGQAAPTANPWSWTNLSHVLWVEQPVGTGFSQGVPNISNDDELAVQLTGFLEQFLNVFSELKGKDFYLSGESYAGIYVPYIANWIYEHPGLDLHLKGIWIADPTISSGVVQQEIPALRFVQANRNLFPFTSSFMATLQNISDSCGYTDYFNRFVTYPPAGQLPQPIGTEAGSLFAVESCQIHNLIQDAVTRINPVFNVYRVSDTWPNLWSVLGFPRSTQEFIYFNRQVQDVIHAPRMEWTTCANNAVYIDPATGGPGFDQSLPPSFSVLPNVIEKSVRTVIVHGLADFILLSEGTRITIQNMTWGGRQGFQTPIQDETFTIKNMGVLGNTHTERNLTYVEFYYSGHMTPQFVPWAAFSTISYLLGRQANVSTV